MPLFNNIRGTLQKAVQAAYTGKKGDRLDKLGKAYNALSLSEVDKRAIIDHVIRDVMIQIRAEDSSSLPALENFITFSIDMSRRNICSTSVPVVLLADLFDTFTLDQCEVLFNYVENNVSIWKENLFFTGCKNNLLRMCNDLLRRLSRSQNTVFRGRILLFLSKFFPFSERSGLNIVSEFNVKDSAEADVASLDSFEEMETEDSSEAVLRVDYNLYNKFLTLQDFCHSPNQCYNNVRWRVFMNSSTEVLAAFRNYKLEDELWTEKSTSEQLSDATSPMFFAKYLNNPKLLELQLSDPNFRRSILIQLLILLQYITSPVKFKQDSYELKPEQVEWVKAQVSLVYELLAETPGNSKRFADTVRHFLAREELWNCWKNEGCPEFKKPAIPEDLDETKPRSRLKRKNVDELLKDAASQNKYYMAHNELTRLWNLNTNNLESCKAKERNFLPEMKDYFEEALVQMDPESNIEAEYKKVNDTNFGWRALRLLAQRTPSFFMHTDHPIIKLPDYIEASLRRVMKDKPVAGTAKTPVEADEGDVEEEVVELKTDGEDTELQQPKQRDTKLTPEMLTEVAKLVGDQWRKLATKLLYVEDDIKRFEENNDSPAASAELMLTTWVASDEDATLENLAYILEGLGFVEASNFLKPK